MDQVHEGAFGGEAIPSFSLDYAATLVKLELLIRYIIARKSSRSVKKASKPSECFSYHCHKQRLTEILIPLDKHFCIL